MAVSPQAGPDPQHDEDARLSLGHGMSFAAMSFATSAMVTMASSITTSHIYGVKVIGEYALVSAPWALVAQLSTLNEQVALVKAVAVLPPRHPRISGLLGVVLGFSFLLTAAVAVVAMAVTALIFRGPVGRPDLILPAGVILAGYTVIENTSWNLDMVFAAFRRGRDLYLIRAAVVVTFLTVGVGGVIVTHSVWALTWATVASFLIPFLLRLGLIGRLVAVRGHRHQLTAALPELPGMLRFGIRVVPGTVASGVSTNVGTYVLGSAASVGIVGAFSRAAGLSSRLADAGFRVCEMLFPTLVRAWEADDREEFHRILSGTLRLTAVALFPPIAAACGVARSVMGVFGPGFARGTDALIGLLLAWVFVVFGRVQAQAFLAADRPTMATVVSLVRMAVTVVTVYPFAVSWGATGVALSFLAGAVVEAVIRDVLLHRRVLRPGDRLGTAGLVIRLALTSGAAFAIAHLLQPASGALLRAGLALAAGLLTAVGMIVATRLVRPDEIRLAVAAVRRRSAQPATV